MYEWQLRGYMWLHDRTGRLETALNGEACKSLLHDRTGRLESYGIIGNTTKQLHDRTGRLENQGQGQ